MLTAKFNLSNFFSPDGVSNALAPVAQLSANNILTFIVTSFKEAKSGRIYKRGQTTHQASAPGESPAIDIGALASSFRVRQTGIAEFETYSTDKKAKLLDEGTSRIAARPFKLRAIEHERPALIKNGLLALERLNR